MQSAHRKTATTNRPDFYLEKRKFRAAHAQSWMVSYSDLITQLLVFFVVIMSISKISAVKYEQLQTALKGEATSETPTEKIKSALEEVLIKHNLQKEASVTEDPEGIAVTMRDSMLFGSGEATIGQNHLERFRPVVGALRDLPEYYRFFIEGHTDDVPIQNGAFPSNWHLSTARAISVLQVFVSEKISEKRLSVQGYGEHKPMVPNRNAKGEPLQENRNMNRRVVIRIK